MLSNEPMLSSPVEDTSSNPQPPRDDFTPADGQFSSSAVELPTPAPGEVLPTASPDSASSEQFSLPSPAGVEGEAARPPESAALPGTGENDDDWEELGESDGVRTWKKNFPNNRTGFRGEVTLKCGIERVYSVFVDSELRDEFMDRISSSEIVERSAEHPHDIVEYFTIAMPWPLWVRDVLVRSQARIDQHSGSILMETRSITHDAKPPQSGMVRCLNDSTFTLSPLSAEQRPLRRDSAGAEGACACSLEELYQAHAEYLRVTVEAVVDPAGWLPSWAVNQAQATWPSRTLTRLRQILEDRVDLPVHPTWAPLLKHYSSATMVTEEAPKEG
eukprot:RCo047457